MHLNCHSQCGKITAIFRLKQRKLANSLFIHMEWRHPFTWKNPLGYLCATCLQFVVMYCIGLYFNAQLSLQFGAIMFTVEFAKDTIVELRSLNECQKIKNSEWDIVKTFTKIIAALQELSKN